MFRKSCVTNCNGNYNAENKVKSLNYHEIQKKERGG